MDEATLKSRLILMVMVPLLEDIVAHDPEAAALVKGWNCVVRMQAGSVGPATQLIFADGKMTAEPGREGRALVTLDFQSAQNLNANFGFGGERKKPRLGGGLAHIIIVMRFAKLLTFLQRYLKPRDEAGMSAEAKDLRARLLLRLSVSGIPEIAEGDESAAPLAKGVPEGVCRWKILPDGPAMTLRVSGGRFKTYCEDAQDADAKVDFKNTDAALGIMTGKSNPMLAMTNGELAITGKTHIAISLLPLQDKLGKALK